MPHYHAADLDVRLLTMSLADTIKNPATTSRSTWQSLIDRTAAQLVQDSDTLLERDVPCFEEESSLHFLGRDKNVPFKMVFVTNKQSGSKGPRSHITAKRGNKDDETEVEAAFRDRTEAQSDKTQLPHCSGSKSAVGYIQVPASSQQKQTYDVDKTAAGNGNTLESRHTRPRSRTRSSTPHSSHQALKDAQMVVRGDTLAPQALSLAVKLSMSCFDRSINGENIQDLKIEVFLDGELTHSRYIASRDRFQAGKSIELFSGSRIERNVEFAWTLKHHRCHTVSDSGDSTHKGWGAQVPGGAAAWSGLCEKLRCTADTYQVNAEGHQSPTADYLESLAGLSRPILSGTHDCSLLSVIDVVISLGEGKKYPAFSGYLTRPAKLDSQDKFAAACKKSTSQPPAERLQTQLPLPKCSASRVTSKSGSAAKSGWRERYTSPTVILNQPIPSIFDASDIVGEKDKDDRKRKTKDDTRRERNSIGFLESIRSGDIHETKDFEVPILILQKYKGSARTDGEKTTSVHSSQTAITPSSATSSAPADTRQLSAQSNRNHTRRGIHGRSAKQSARKSNTDTHTSSSPISLTLPTKRCKRRKFEDMRSDSDHDSSEAYDQSPLGIRQTGKTAALQGCVDNALPVRFANDLMPPPPVPAGRYRRTPVEASSDASPDLSTITSRIQALAMPDRPIKRLILRFNDKDEDKSPGPGHDGIRDCTLQSVTSEIQPHRIDFTKPEIVLDGMVSTESATEPAGTLDCPLTTAMGAETKHASPADGIELSTPEVQTTIGCHGYRPVRPERGGWFSESEILFGVRFLIPCEVGLRQG